MELRHLRLVREVAEKGSLTKARDTLFLSQSALSHQLKELEEELGTQMFHRVNKKLVLTSAGKIILESAEKVLSEVDKAELMIRKHTTGDEGTIKLTTQCYTCYHWLPSLMVDFYKEFPKVKIEIFSDDKYDTEKQVISGDLDIAIVSQKRQYPMVRYYELFEDEMIALVSVDHAYANKKYLKAEDFETETLIIHSYPLKTVEVIRSVLTPAGTKAGKVLQAQVTEAAVEMVKIGIGIHVIARWMARPYLVDKGLVALPVTRGGLLRKWYAVTLDKKDPLQYVENFIEHLKRNIEGVCHLSN